MRILIVDTELAGLDFAQRAVADGHEVRLAIGKTPHPIGKGFPGVKVVEDWRESMSWVGKDGLVLPTGNAKFLRELDRYRDLGFGVFGPTVQSAQLEINREAGMKLLQEAGIEVPHYETFNGLEEAERFARKSDKAWVFKTLGSEEDKALTFVSSDPAEMVGWIRRQRDRGLTLKGSCMLQEKIDLFCELGVSRWMGAAGFVGPPNLCWEHKKLMDGEIGPNTGEQGSVLAYQETEKLADEMLNPLELAILKMGHRGDTAINFGIGQDGKAWFLEFTMRAGWPAFYIQTASHKGDVAKWMRDALDGKDTLKVDTRPAVGVVLAQPPYPKFNGDPDCVDGNPISGIDEVWDDAHPVMMQIARGPTMKGGKVVDAPIYQTAGELVAVITGLGPNIEAAREKAYKSIDKVGFSDAMYRQDIGEKVIKALPKLKRFGYAEGLEP